MNHIRLRSYLRIATDDLEGARDLLLWQRVLLREAADACPPGDDVDCSRLTKEADTLDRVLNKLEEAQLELGTLL